MVLEGFLSPDKGLDLRIRKTFDPYAQTAFDEDGYLVTNARVSIYQDGILIDSCEENGKGQYLSIHPDVYDETKSYEVRINAPNLPEAYVRDIKTPSEPLVNLEQSSFRLEKENESAYAEVTLQNPDHYAIYEVKARYDSRQINEVPVSAIQENTVGASCEMDSYYISNKCKAGGSFKATYYIELYKSIPGEWENEFLPKDYIYIEVGQVDPRYRDYIDKSNASDEPFIEPTLDPGNVDGGYGFIVGWNTEAFTYEL